MKCHSRYIKNPEQNKRRQYSNGKRTLLKENPRKGVCSKCDAKVGINCVFTVMRSGIEVCPSCSARIGQQTGELKSIAGFHKGRKHSPEHIANMSKALKGRVGTRLGKKNGEYQKEQMRAFRMTQVFPQTDTKIEKTIQKLLNDNEISFATHKVFRVGNRMHQVDIFVEPNLCIECDGEYWHSLPEQVIRDRIIDTELLKQKYIVLRLSENDIMTNVTFCLNKIKEKISMTNLA
jgi:very-short-patch-repair endonuclease